MKSYLLVGPLVVGLKSTLFPRSKLASKQARVSLCRVCQVGENNNNRDCGVAGLLLNGSVYFWCFCFFVML